MTAHPDEDRLLDYSLFGDDAAVAEHVSACAECRRRLDACRAEEKLVRDALGPARVRRPRRLAWPLSFAAVFLVAVAAGFAISRRPAPDTGRLERENAALRTRVTDLERRLSAPPPLREPQLAGLRDSVGSVGQQMARSRQQALARGEKEVFLTLEEMQSVFAVQYLLLELTMELELGPSQIGPVRLALDRMMKSIAGGGEPERAFEAYEAALRAELRPEQFSEYRRLCAREMREDEIDMILLDLSIELDLEEEELEEAAAFLDVRIPERPTRARLWIDVAACGALLDDRALAAGVRERLPEKSRGKFDRYLEENVRARETARAARGR